eukprot:10247424-Prorocentrum_lima.AAC.1
MSSQPLGVERCQCLHPVRIGAAMARHGLGPFSARRGVLGCFWGQLPGTFVFRRRHLACCYFH